MSSDDEELAKLMREIDAMTGSQPSSQAEPTPQAQLPVPAASKEVAGSGGSAKGKWVLMAAVGGGVVGAIVGMLLFFLPGVSAWSTGIGAALGAAVVALISKPPRWLD